MVFHSTDLTKVLSTLVSTIAKSRESRLGGSCGTSSESTWARYTYTRLATCSWTVNNRREEPRRSSLQPFA